MLKCLFGCAGRELASDVRTVGVEGIKPGVSIQMAAKSQQKMDEEAARPPLQSIPVLLSEQVSLPIPILLIQFLLASSVLTSSLKDAWNVHALASNYDSSAARLLSLILILDPTVAKGVALCKGSTCFALLVALVSLQRCSNSAAWCQCDPLFWSCLKHGLVIILACQ